jgi:hypothetical protein
MMSDKAKWVKWRSGGGPRVRGDVGFAPPAPRGPWTKVLGVVARCEGKHDTVVMYDGTGVTAGFLQWTFTSGRLQRLLESFKALPSSDGDPGASLFDEACRVGGDPAAPQLFEAFGFRIEGGRFVAAADGRALDPSSPAHKKRIVDLCLGAGSGAPVKAALKLADVVAAIGSIPAVGAAQIAFAKGEFSRELDRARRPLSGRTIRALLGADDEAAWEVPLVALFFNLWQNNPGAAYKLFLKAEGEGGAAELFERAWKLTNRSRFGRWGWPNDPKSPRCLRIAEAVEELFGQYLPFYK